MIMDAIKPAADTRQSARNGTLYVSLFKCCDYLLVRLFRLFRLFRPADLFLGYVLLGLCTVRAMYC